MQYKAVVFALVSCFVASAQTGANSQPGTCNPVTLQTAASLSFLERACMYGEQLASPQFALVAGFSAAFGQFQNSPHIPRQHFDEFPHRFAAYYGTRTARDAGELIAGYLHHEDTRYRRSNETRLRRRIEAAFLSVLTSPDEDGDRRMAYAPIAGSLSAAFAGSAMFRHNETVSDALLHAGLIYSHYYVRALGREFRPEMDSYVRRILHRDKN